MSEILSCAEGPGDFLQVEALSNGIGLTAHERGAAGVVRTATVVLNATDATQLIGFLRKLIPTIGEKTDD